MGARTSLSSMGPRGPPAPLVLPEACSVSPLLSGSQTSVVNYSCIFGSGTSLSSPGRLCILCGFFSPGPGPVPGAPLGCTLAGLGAGPQQPCAFQVLEQTAVCLMSFSMFFLK